LDLRFINFKSRLSTNANVGEPKLVKDKVVLAICFCLILVLAGFGVWSYVGAKGLESKVNDLESEVDDLETQNTELESKVNDSKSRVGEQLLIVGYPDESESVLFMMMHMGTTEVTVSEIRVDNVLNSSSPGWVGNGTLMPGQMGEIILYGLKYFDDGFAEGASHEFEFTTARGNSFYCVVLFEGWTFTPTEQLEIQGCAFSTGNVTLTVQNTGTSDLTVSKYKTSNAGTILNLPQEVAVAQGDSESVTVPLAWSAGTTYDIYLITSTGKQFQYRATAP